MAGVEFLVQALLADFDIELSAQERLLVPQLPEASGAIGFNPTGGLERIQIVGAEITAVDLQSADVGLCG